MSSFTLLFIHNKFTILTNSEMKNKIEIIIQIHSHSKDMSKLIKLLVKTTSLNMKYY